MEVGGRQLKVSPQSCCFATYSSDRGRELLFTTTPRVDATQQWCFKSSFSTLVAELNCAAQTIPAQSKLGVGEQSLQLLSLIIIIRLNPSIHKTSSLFQGQISFSSITHWSIFSSDMHAVSPQWDKLTFFSCNTLLLRADWWSVNSYFITAVKVTK